MTLQALTLQNFKRHEQAELAFVEGLTSITGENAAGKTTILKSIVFALFGPAAAGVKEHLTTRGSNQRLKVELQLTLPKHGRVTVSRDLKNASVMDDHGKLLANGVTAVNKLIEEAYGLPAQTLNLLMYSKQGEATGLLTMGATALQKLVEQLAKSDLVNQVLDQISVDSQVAAAKLSTMGEPEGIDELESQRVAVNRDLIGLHEEVLGLTADLSTKREQEQALRQTLTEAQRRATEAAHLKARLTQVSAKLEASIREQAELNLKLQDYPDCPELEDLEAALRDKEQRLAAAETVAQTRLIALANYNRAAKQQESLVARQEANQTLAAQLGPAKAEYETAQQKEQEVRTLLGAARLDCDQAQQAVDSAVCHACKRPFSVNEAVLARAKLNSANKALHELEHTAFDVKQEASRLRIQYESLERAYDPALDARIQALTEEAQRAQEVLSGLPESEDTQALEQEIREARQELQRLRRIQQERICLLTSLVHTQQEQERLVAELAELSNAEQALPELPNTAELETDLAETVKHIGELTTAMSNRQAEIARLTEQHKTLQARLAKAKEDKAQYDQLTKDLARRKQLGTWLRQSRTTLIKGIWDSLLHHASSLVTSATGGQITRIFREDELMVEERGELVPVSELSGFQRSAVGLAIRLSLSRVFYGTGLFALLDEPTADASDENAARIAGMLRALQSQVIYITHRQGDAVNAESMICL